MYHHFIDNIIMVDETEFKTIVLRSNIRTEDSLTSFGNPVPAQFLNPYYEHEVALTGFGLHCQFKNAGSPMNAIYPSLIQIFKMDFKSATGYDDPSLVRRESFKIISPTIIIFLGTRPYIRRGFDAQWRI